MKREKTEYITINHDTIYDNTETPIMKKNPKSKSKSKSKLKRKHLDSDNFVMPEIKDYNSFKPNKYKVQELKDICKYYR